VLADIKPVWLMSPLSVSDTLPLEAGFFDVVIFDEASQIPVEDAIPALYRASQVIVVGDQMQLPPTKFFASSNQSEEESLILEEDEEKVEISLEADSFLSQSALNLPSTMLGWHYRSRSEALIGYSNAAFYSGALLTIPDRSLPNLGQSEINVKRGQSGEDFVDRLLERSLSFHFHSEGVYEDRRNRSEADYIAGLVRALLLKQTGKSLGIVAFSEAQQTEIETALKRLGEQDTEFRELLEKEQDREEHGQFCGLFVKNLENVQGDERDVILLSVCYGYDRNRRMLMNFGPINQRGGEKRLNVIFSRAKEHMAIVSSIRYTDIKNEYNDGANNLRLFLQYAEVFSRGEWDNARRILSNLNPDAKKAFSHGGVQDEVIEQLAAGLRQRGWIVDQGVGQSRFRCDLAIRDPQSPSYVLGLFVDLEERVWLAVCSRFDQRLVSRCQRSIRSAGAANTRAWAS
jgi:superfamily I DNA and/or RNA helicase